MRLPGCPRPSIKRVVIRSVLLVFLAVLSFTNALVAQIKRPPLENVLVNGGFEQQTAGWSFLTTGATATGGIDGTVKHEGKYSYKISNRTGFAPNVYARLVQMVSGLRPFTVYKVSCWAKGKGCGINWIGGGPGWYKRTQFPHGDFDWQEVTFEIDAGASPDLYEFMVLSESATEALWVDDIRIEAVRVDQAKQDALYGKLDSQLARVKERLSGLRNAAKRNDPYVQLGEAVADRFIGFVETGGRDGKLSLGWMQLQLEELNEVLDETEKLAGANRAADWRPMKTGPVKLKDGIFYQRGQPYYFAGYGHFGSVILDLPNFPALGASLIQDGTAGPSSMAADGTLLAGASNMLAGLDHAAQFGMRTDFLLSPHYFPEWALTPDVRNSNIGFINFNIFHPKAKAVIEKWAQVMARELKNKPALHSVCIANEPVYDSSGRDVYTHPEFERFLEQKHRDIATLNTLYGTHYTNFQQVAVPADHMPSTREEKRAYYDWTTFNKQMFAGWHKSVDSVLKHSGLKVPTHTKIMVFQSLDRDKQGYGVDPELMCDATDLAGCDDYAFFGGVYAYDWLQNEFFYDLLHSFRGQSVFNSENHVIPDGAGPSHIPMNHTRAVLWQGGLHHQGSTTIWVWEQAADQSLAGSIYFRPANVFGAGLAMEDLNRLGREVMAINQAKPTAALLYSQPSIFWDEKYQGTIYSLYTALNFLGQNITFISERELANGKAAKVPWLVVPSASRVLNTTSKALARWARSGGKVLLVGKDSLRRDEYDRELSQGTDKFPTIELAANDEATAALLHETMASMPVEPVRDTSTGKPAWAVEYRIVKQGGSMLIPIINFNKEAKTVSFPARTARPARDLISGEDVKLDSVRLESMLPRLLKVQD